MKAFNLSDEQTKRLLAELRRIQLLTRGKGEDREILFWGEDDWAVVLYCMVRTGIIHVADRIPYTQFLLFLKTNEVPLREPDLIDAKSLSRAYDHLKEGFPWHAAEQGNLRQCIPRWRNIHDWLLPLFEDIARR